MELAGGWIMGMAPQSPLAVTVSRVTNRCQSVDDSPSGRTQPAMRHPQMCSPLLLLTLFQVVVVGGHATLGNWDVSKGLKLKWTEGHVWEASLELPSG